MASRRIINQSEAARLRQVSRQSISELVRKGRFTVPLDDNNNPIKGSVYEDEVLNYTNGKHGRPRLSEAEKERRGLSTFMVGESVIWNHKPRDGYGYHMEIPAIVKKNGLKRIFIEFRDANGQPTNAWVNKDVCQAVSK